MTVESIQDRLDLLTDFGSDATIGVDTVKGILDREFRIVGGIESEYPVFECRSSDISGAGHGTNITIEAVTYQVVGVEDDGTGMTTLVLALT